MTDRLYVPAEHVRCTGQAVMRDCLMWDMGSLATDHNADPPQHQRWRAVLRRLS